PIYRAPGVVGWRGNAVGRKGGRNKLRPYIQRFCIFVRIFKYKQTIALPIKCATPLWMLERRNIAFGMGHQAKDVALRIADACNIADRAVGIIRVGNFISCLRGIDEWYLPVLLQ